MEFVIRIEARDMDTGELLGETPNKIMTQQEFFAGSVWTEYLKDTWNECEKFLPDPEEAYKERPQIQNGFLTLSKTDTEEHRTFRIKTQSQDAKFAPGERVIGLLTGPNNEENYENFGFVKSQGITVWNSKKKKGGIALVEWYADMLNVLVGGYNSRYDKADQYRAQFTFNLDGRCIRCNRRLTTPWSVENGIGPICARKM